jgi:hypothetical protein
LVFVFELFDGIMFAIFYVSALVNMAETTRANKLSDLILSPENGFMSLWREVISLFLHVSLYLRVVIGISHWRAFV